MTRTIVGRNPPLGRKTLNDDCLNWFAYIAVWQVWAKWSQRVRGQGHDQTSDMVKKGGDISIDGSPFNSLWLLLVSIDLIHILAGCHTEQMNWGYFDFVSFSLFCVFVFVVVSFCLLSVLLSCSWLERLESSGLFVTKTGMSSSSWISCAVLSSFWLILF